MLRKIEGTVQTYRAIDVRNVQFEIQGANNIIDLNVGQPWVLKNGDYVVVTGEDNGRFGKFKGYAYRNDTKQIFGKSDSGFLDGFGLCACHRSHESRAAGDRIEGTGRSGRRKPRPRTHDRRIQSGSAEQRVGPQGSRPGEGG